MLQASSSSTGDVRNNDKKGPSNSQQRPSFASASSASVGVIPPSTFKPYETSLRETPFFHMILDLCCLSCIQPLLRILYRVRWLLSYPLRTRLMPKWVPPCSSVPVLNQVATFTVGELILCIPLIVFVLQAYSYSFVQINIIKGGNMATYCIMMAYLTANKSNSFFSFIMGIPFERMLPLHSYSSLAAVTAAMFHARAGFATSADSNYSQLFPDTTDWKLYLLDGLRNLSGTAALICMLTMVGLSIHRRVLRHWFYNLWLCLHVTAAVGVLVALFLHSVSSLIFIALWWGLDLLTRYVVQASCRHRIPKAQLRRIGANDGEERGQNEPAIEISFPKPDGFAYNPGQFVRICVPALSIYEFHPVSLSSAPHEPNVTMHIRALGNWTSRLVELVNKNSENTDGSTNNNNIITTTVLLEGPYGSLQVDLDDENRYKMVLCVAGGIGVTPCQSIGKTLLYQHRTLGRKLKHVKLVWAVRDLRIVHDIPPLGGTEDFSRHSTLMKRQSLLIEKTTTRSSSTWQATSQELGTGTPSRMSTSSAGASRRRQSLPAVGQCDIYCSRQVCDEETQDLPGNYNFFEGRPNLDAIFQEMKATALATGEHNIVVIACGPTSLMHDVEIACRKYSESVVGCGVGVFFDLHTERFEF